MKQYFLVDAEGWPDYDSSQVFMEGEEEEGYILGWEEPFYKPKWSGTAWIEGATETEIEEATKEPEKSLEELTASQLVTAVNMVAKDLPDESILQVPLIFDAWEVGVDYEVGDICRHNGNLYRVRQAHTSQADWPPSLETASLFLMISPPEEEGQVKPWEDRHKTGKELYKKGDKATHKGRLWESGVDNNHWEPGAPGVYENIWKDIGPA